MTAEDKIPQLIEIPCQWNSIFVASGEMSYDLIPAERISLILDTFNDLADDKGLLETKHLHNLMKQLGENPTKEEVQDMINEVDKDGVGSIRWLIIMFLKWMLSEIIRFPAFLSMMASKLDTLVAEDDIREAFRVFDVVSVHWVLSLNL